MPFHTYPDEFLIISCATRIIGGCIALAISACLGRQKFLYVSAIVGACGLALIGLPLSFDTGVLLMFFTIPILVCLPFGLDFYQQEQSLEAFTTTKKPWSLATIGVFEQFTHVALIAASMNLSISVLFLSIGVGIIILSCILMALVPDTRNLSLRETRNKYNELMTGPSATIASSAVWSNVDIWIDEWNSVKF